MKRYVLDSDVFITAFRSYYAFDLAPAFWTALVQEATNGSLLSIDRVKDELGRGNDELSQWANTQFRQFFASTNNESTMQTYGEIMRWANGGGHFNNAALDEFAVLENADAWLVAYSISIDGIVVTNETFDPKIRRKIKIPNVCQAFALDYVTVFQMLRALGIRLS